jgi:hypothetical protein
MIRKFVATSLGLCLVPLCAAGLLALPPAHTAGGSVTVPAVTQLHLPPQGATTGLHAELMQWSLALVGDTQRRLGTNNDESLGCTRYRIGSCAAPVLNGRFVLLVSSVPEGCGGGPPSCALGPRKVLTDRGAHRGSQPWAGSAHRFYVHDIFVAEGTDACSADCL